MTLDIATTVNNTQEIHKIVLDIHICENPIFSMGDFLVIGESLACVHEWNEVPFSASARAFTFVAMSKYFKMMGEILKAIVSGDFKIKRENSSRDL